jgi:hypothetical protein
MGTILVPLFAHYPRSPPPVQAAVAGGLLLSLRAAGIAASSRGSI